MKQRKTAPSKAEQTEAYFQRSGPLGGLKVSLRMLGPGLITGASDDDPSGIGTYASGQEICSTHGVVLRAERYAR